MNCVICKQGETVPGKTTVTLNRGPTTVIVKDVPAEVCRDCGEYYLSEPVSEWLLERADHAAESGTEVEILRYAA